MGSAGGVVGESWRLRDLQASSCFPTLKANNNISSGLPDLGGFKDGNSPPSGILERIPERSPP